MIRQADSRLIDKIAPAAHELLLAGYGPARNRKRSMTKGRARRYGYLIACGHASALSHDEINPEFLVAEGGAQ